MNSLSCNCVYYDNSVFTVLPQNPNIFCEAPYYPQTETTTETQGFTATETLVDVVLTTTALPTRTVIVPPPPHTTNWFFSPYKDITQNMNWNTFQMEPIKVLDSLANITLAFATGKCGSETWGGVKPENINYPHPFILSTGGANGEFNCYTDVGFATFLGAYPNMTGIDFDLELTQSSQDIDQLLLRVLPYPDLRKSYTLATLGGNSANNLNSLGQMVVSKLQASNVTNWYINLMTMDYGSANPTVCTVVNGVCDMYTSAVAAVESLHSFYNIPYSQIEVTPMIGTNDVAAEVFTEQNARDLAMYATRVGLAAIHFWSVDRDKDQDYINIFKQYV